MADLTASKACALCGGPLDEHDLDRGTCHDCRSRDGEIADLDIAIRASGDNPERILDWPVIRHLLRKRFGEDRSDAELWERCTDWLRAEGRLGPNDYLPLPLNYLQWLLEHGFIGLEQQSAHLKLEALRSFQRELEAWKDFNSRKEAGIQAMVVPIGHPLLEAVVALQPCYGGMLPKPALGLWRTLLKLARRNDETAKVHAQLLAEWLIEEIESHCTGERPDVDHAEMHDAESDPKVADPTAASVKTIERGENQAAVRLLSLFTNGLADERLDKAGNVLDNEMLTVDEKLWKIDALVPIPPTVSAANLGKALRVSKTAVQNTTWYNEKRKGQRASEIGRRQEQHGQRGQQYEPDRQLGDD